MSFRFESGPPDMKIKGLVIIIIQIVAVAAVFVGGWLLGTANRKGETKEYACTRDARDTDWIRGCRPYIDKIDDYWIVEVSGQPVKITTDPNLFRAEIKVNK